MKDRRKQCAFCNYTGKLTDEHIFAKWMRELFPGMGEGFYIGGPSKRNVRFPTDTIDWKANVVCESCNNTWMSDIESKHGKPVLHPFITGEISVPITPEIAHSIAIHSFKTAVVANHNEDKSNPFFSTRLRHAFGVPGLKCASGEERDWTRRAYGTREEVPA